MQKDWPLEKFQFKIELLNGYLQMGTFNTYTVEVQLEYIDFLERVANQGLENVVDNINKESEILIAKYATMMGVLV